MTEPRKIRIFYSWQSDLPNKTNRSLIQRALRAAADELENTQSDLAITVDEATRDTSGSPNIPLTILKKIEESDLVVVDVTTVTPSHVQRSCPNPNVTFELGFAVAHLGWDRVVMLFNEAFGVFPGDLPFDFTQHRTWTYEMTEDAAANTKADLQKFLVTAVGAIVEKDPKRPKELQGLSLEETQRSRDVQNIDWFLSTIHLPTLDEFIMEMPWRMSERAVWYWEGFRELMFNSLFHIYDKDLSRAIEEFSESWFCAMAHPDEYNPAANGLYYVFYNPLDMPLPDDRQTVWDEMDSGRRNMRIGLDRILHIVRDTYLEIDISATNDTAWRQFAEFQRKARQSLEDEDDDD